MITCPLVGLSFNNIIPSKFYIFLICSGVLLIIGFFWQRVRKIRRLNEVKLEKMEEKKRKLTLEYEKEEALNQALNKRLRRYATLKHVAEDLSSTLSLEELSELILAQTSKVIGKGEQYFLSLVYGKGEGFSVLSQQRKSKLTKMEFKKQGDVFDHWVLRQKQPLIVTDTQKDFRFNPGKQNYRSLIIAPIISKERIVGLLRINDKNSYVFSPGDLRLLDIISGLSSVTIENALLYQRTEELAIRDGLTSLYVQSYFKKQLAEECERAGMSKVAVSVLMCDLDYFKKYNDQYGHTAGDILLKQIADILQEKTGSSGLVARYGGEEFALILPEQSKEQSLSVAEDIRKTIARKIFLLRRERTKISISIGVVSFPRDGLDAEKLIAAADRALYKAKEQGRNRVCCL